MLSWMFELLNRQDQVVGELDGVTGGRWEIVAQSPLGGSASLELDDVQPIDWLSHRIRAWFLNGAVRFPVGTYLFTSPTEKHDGVKTRFDVDLLTKMNVVLEDTVEGQYSVPVGTNIINRVVSLIKSTGETRIAATLSTSTSRGMTFDPGTPKLEIINKLLEEAGYWSLWCDGSGLFRVEPYVNPADRPIAHTFQHGEDSLHFPDWDREQNMSDVPNRFVAWRDGDDENPPLVGVATNEDPESPFSFQARGRWITATESGVEADSQAVMDQHAARRLRDAMSPVNRFKVGHAMLPLDPNQLVEFIPEDGVRRLATIQRMSGRFEPFTDVGAEWRGI